jgi:hypothetical protein
MHPAPQSPPPQKSRHTGLVLLGALIALIAGAAIAWLLLSGGRAERSPPPPASTGGLVIDSTATDDRLDPARPLRCFVAGQFVGEFTLAECAQRNGVATDALDVGVDETGALAAAEQAGTTLTPLPPEDLEAPETPTAGADLDAEPLDEPLAACWRYAGGRWRRLPGDVGRMTCAQTLFAGRCEQPGGATYGRWGQQTLRLVPGRIEVSDDNRSFRTLAEQGPGCSTP